MAVLGLCFCARAFSSCGKWGPLFIAVRGPLTITASLVAEHRLSNGGSRAQLLRSIWDLPRPGIEPVSPALAGRLNHCATREARKTILLAYALYCFINTFCVCVCVCVLGGCKYHIPLRGTIKV